MHGFVLSPFAGYAAAILALVGLVLDTTTGYQWAGMALQVSLIAGVAVSNYRLNDFSRRLERIESLLMRGPGDHHKRGTH